MPTRRKPYPSDVSDEEWSLVVPYLTLMREDAMQREHSLRELFNGLRYVVRYGIAWRAMPNDLRPGSQCINRHSAGWRRAASRPWRRICVPCCALLPAVRRSRPRRSSTAGPCVRHPKAANVLVTMEPSVSVVLNYIWPSIRLAICWPCTSHPPTSMIVPRFDDFQRNASLLGSFGRRLSGVALIDVGKGDTLARRFPGLRTTPAAMGADLP